MRYFILCFVLLLSLTTISAKEQRNLLQKSMTQKDLVSVLQSADAWVPYPAYRDRAGWKQLMGTTAQEAIESGQNFLDYEWKVVKLSDYLAFERTGSRDIMQDPFGQNINALMSLVVAELAEGEGRFMDQILNGVWYYCEMTSWVLSAHLYLQKEVQRAIPDPYEYTIDLTAGDMGSFLSWVYYFFKSEWDEIHPLIGQRLRQNLEDRILTPYMERNDFWWQAIDIPETRSVNNWNPWCNFNVLTSFLLLEQDPQRRAAAVYKTMISVDQFINYNHEDGACEEGPSYWGHAAGKMFDYLDLLHKATQGKVDLFDEEIILNLGEYISKSYIGDGWVVNFADATARSSGKYDVIFRYGQAVNSKEMMSFAAYLYEQKKSGKKISWGRDLYRGLEILRVKDELKATKPALPNYTSAWFSETEFCYMKNSDKFFLAAKGGFNAESHNHNDVGSFILFYQHQPVFIDVGVGTYTRQTFSSERYKIWTMQSQYHNLPQINGMDQLPGRNYKSSQVSFDEHKQRFQLDISKAYGSEAFVKQWMRTYHWSNATLEIEDDYQLTQWVQPSVTHFMVWHQPEIIAKGKMRIKMEGQPSMILDYDAKNLSYDIQEIPIDDRRLGGVWGTKVYRISFTNQSKQHHQKIKYRIYPES